MVAGTSLRVTILTESDDFLAFGASRGFEGRWIGQLLEVEFICAKVHVLFGLDALAAFSTLLPLAIVPFDTVMPTQGIAVMIARTAIAGV